MLFLLVVIFFLRNNDYANNKEENNVTTNNILLGDFSANFIDNSDFDWSSLANSMDLSFNVELLYSFYYFSKI